MPSPCPCCTGKLYSKGKRRSPVCNACGYSETLQRGRPRNNPDRLVTDRDVYQAKKIAADRIVTYALFDPLLLPEGAICVIYRCALVGTAVGCSRKSVERDRPGLRAVPLGSLRAGEKRWVTELGAVKSLRRSGSRVLAQRTGARSLRLG